MKTYTARTPLDLIALAPYLLGFHPADSVVLMTFGAGEPFHARVDLPDSLDGQEALSQMLREVVREHRVPTVAVLVYSEDVEAAATMAGLLVVGLTGDGVDVVDALRVEDTEYFDCLDPALPGTTYDLSAHPFTAARVYDGQVAHDSRSALADTLVGTDEDDRLAVHRAADRFATRVLADAGIDSLHDAGDRWVGEQGEWLRDLVLGLLTAPRRPSPAECGRVLLLLTQMDLRDLAWLMIGRDDARQHVDLWSELVRRAPDELLPGPAALLAFAAWQAGDGALAWCAIDRCLALDPDYRLAELIGDLLTRAVPPSAWTRMREGLGDSAPSRRRAG
ncbi:MAG TPA: DUF4192 domain-containing protein [Marmoricola sp.]|jgi:hypothetical protein|nr:DUF4192 domain-containing protein [Marmoricola sp.]